MSEEVEEDSSRTSRVALPEVPLPLLDGLCVEVAQLFIRSAAVGRESEEPLLGCFRLPRNDERVVVGAGRFDATELELGLLMAS